MKALMQIALLSGVTIIMLAAGARAQIFSGRAEPAATAMAIGRLKADLGGLQTLSNGNKQKISTNTQDIGTNTQGISANAQTASTNNAYIEHLLACQKKAEYYDSGHSGADAGGCFNPSSPPPPATPPAAQAPAALVVPPSSSTSPACGPNDCCTGLHADWTSANGNTKCSVRTSTLINGNSETVWDTASATHSGKATVTCSDGNLVISNSACVPNGCSGGSASWWDVCTAQVPRLAAGQTITVQGTYHGLSSDTAPPGYCALTATCSSTGSCAITAHAVGGALISVSNSCSPAY